MIDHKRPQSLHTEKPEDAQLYLPQPSIGFTTLDSVLRRILKPSHRYKIPLSLLQRAMTELKLETTNALDLECLTPHNRIVPPEWQIILDYLYREGLLVRPHIDFDLLFNDEPKIFATRLRVRFDATLTDGVPPNSGRHSRGVSLDIDEAYSKVIGELLERYPLLLYRSKNLYSGSIAGLEQERVPFLNPFFVAPLGEEQKRTNPKYRFDRHSTFKWVSGFSLTRNVSARMPAQLVFWNYRPAKDEPVFSAPITNGAGGMFTKEGAILSGLYELIQRDAFLIHWYNFISPPRIDISKSKNDGLRKMYESCIRYGLEVHILDTTSDIKVPACVAVLVDPTGKGPAVSLGGGCGPSEAYNAIRALSEAICVRSWLREQKFSFALSDDYVPFSMRVSQRERLSLWQNQDMVQKISFLLGGQVRPPREEKSENRPEKEELRNVAEIFSKKGSAYEIFYYAAQHSALKTLGYHSVRVSVPALLPLYFDEAVAPTASPRIQEACKNMGYVPAKKINSLPHPFP